MGVLEMTQESITALERGARATRVVQVAQASFPSVVIDGDDLNRYVIDVRRAMSLLLAGDGEACLYLLDDVADRLGCVRRDYEATLAEVGRLTPYVVGRDRV
jgi:hypothetical protein